MSFIFSLHTVMMMFLHGIRCQQTQSGVEQIILEKD